MSKSLRTLIEWAHYTVNFWWGCTKVSPACEHCYAEVISKIFGKGRATWGRRGQRWLQWEGATKKLAKIVRAAKREGVRPRVFVNSMSDTFEDNALLDVTRCMALVALADTPEVDVLLLTKRPENVRKMVPPAWLENWPAHIWIGTTVENQATADERIPELLRVPAAVRFLSCEPLLGPVDLSRCLGPWLGCAHYLAAPTEQDRKEGRTSCARYENASGQCRADFCVFGYIGGIDWVICGGESGGGARPMHPDWARSLRDQCAAAGVPFFFKQWGEWLPSCQYRAGDKERLVEKAQHSFDAGNHAWRVGKKAAGRLLDGVQHNAVPSANIRNLPAAQNP